MSDAAVPTRPSPDEYFMGIAVAVRQRANCLGRKVGAILVLDGRIISTGYNGTPVGMPNCTDGGCYRCANPNDFRSGEGYDLCICVHAEQNALIAAARFGIAVEGSIVYSTVRPCFGCLKELIQAKVQGVRYLHDWTPQAGKRREQYDQLHQYFSKGVGQVNIEDPHEAWAMRPARNTPAGPVDETGHAQA